MVYLCVGVSNGDIFVCWRYLSVMYLCVRGIYTYLPVVYLCVGGI